MPGSRACHIHFVKASESEDVRANADYCVATDLRSMGGQACEGLVTSLIEDVAEFLDLATRNGAKRANQATYRADQVRNVAENEFERIVSCIHMTIQFLCVPGASKQLPL